MPIASSAVGWPAASVPHTTIPRSAANSRSIEALRAPASYLPLAFLALALNFAPNPYAGQVAAALGVPRVREVHNLRLVDVDGLEYVSSFFGGRR